MPKFNDETEYDNKPQLRELDKNRPEDDTDQLAVYGATGDDDEDVVTGDEFGDTDDGYGNPEMETGDDGEDEFSDEEGLDDVGDDEDVDLDSETDFGDDDELSDDDDEEGLDDESSESSDLELFQQFKSLLTQIVQSDNPELNDEEVEASVEEAVNYYLNEDASFESEMTEHAKRNALSWEATDIDDLVEALKSAKAGSSYVNPQSIKANQFYRVVKTSLDETKVFTILGTVDAEDRQNIKSDVKREDRQWEDFKSKYADQLDPDQAPDNQNAFKGQFNAISALKRESFVVAGKELINTIKQHEK